MRRKLFNLLTLLSLLLGALTLTVLVRSRTLYDTVILRAAPSYGGWPNVKFVTINVHNGWVIAFKQKREPSFHGIAPPWREDVAFEAKQVVPPDDDDARTMTGAERAAYEAQTERAYRSTPRVRWEVLRIAPGPRYAASTDATDPLWKRLGFNWFIWELFGIDEEDYPGTYRRATLTIPHKAVLVASVVLPALWAGLWIWSYLAGRRVGRCPGCGYDLRASPNRCPECGREVTEAEARRAGFPGKDAPIAQRSANRSRRLLPMLKRRWDIVTFVAVVLSLAYGLYRGAVATRDAPSPDLVYLRREIDLQFADLAQDVARLRESGDAPGADALDADLRRLRDPAAGKTLVTSDTPKLHVVGVFEGSVPEGPVRMVGNEPIGRVVVEVRPTGRPVVLALCGKETVEWQLRVAPGARLQRVVLGGECDEEIVGVPPGVPVEEHTEAGRSPDQFDTYRRYQDIAYFDMEAALRKLTGLPVATFQGDFRLPDRPVVVGPGSPEWEAQRVLAALEPLREAAASRGRQRLLPDMASVRFDAQWRGPHADDRGGRGHRAAVFDLTGPIAGTLRQLPREWDQFTVDPATRTYYGTDGHRLFRLKPGWERAVEVENADGTVRDFGGYCTSLAFDTRRRRLLLCARGAVAYAPDSGAWTTLGRLNSYTSPVALTYLAEEDCFYGVTAKYIKAPAAIVRLGPDGEAQWRVPLTERADIPIYSGRATQLAAVGPLLALIPPMDNESDAAKQEPPRVVLIDPRSNRVVYRSNLVVHAAKPAATEPGSR